MPGGMSGNVGHGGGNGGNGGSGIPAAVNVMDVVVDDGPEHIGYTNGLFASVKLCQPGTSNCQVIDHLLVDTGSVGLRVLESLVTLELADVMSSAGQPLAVCAPFVDGSTWGAVKSADIVLGGETAPNVSIQLIGVRRFTMPSSCTGQAITDLESLGTNGILGVGIFDADCGSACTRAVGNAGYYYACTGPATCKTTTVPETQQVRNPVAALPEDNNGVIIRLPAVPEGGAPQVPGQLVLGIGTRDNNGLGNATIVAVDRYGELPTKFPAGGTEYASIIDSGSNGIFFLDAATSGVPLCTKTGFTDFYCPAATTSLNASIRSAAGIDLPVDFRVANTVKLNRDCFAFADLAGAMPGFPGDPTLPAFDWGLPFFFGRSVYSAIEQKSTPAGLGPFLAF
jgi:hypothetical protein